MCRPQSPDEVMSDPAGLRPRLLQPFVAVSIRLARPQSERVGLIRIGGHLPNGGFDVPNARKPERSAPTPPRRHGGALGHTSKSRLRRSFDKILPPCFSTSTQAQAE